MTKYKYLLAGLLAGLLGNFIIFNALIPNKLSGYYLGNDFDPKLIVWILEWGYHAIRNYPLDFWSANQFFPHKNSLAYSDSLIAVQLFYFPLRSYGFDSISAMFASWILISMAASIFLSDALNRLNVFSNVEIFLIICFSNYTLSSTSFLVSHYQLFGILFAPAIFTYVYVAIKLKANEAVVIGAGLFVFSACVATYILPMLLALYFLVGLYYLNKYREIRSNGLLSLIGGFGHYVWIYLIIIIAALYVFQISPYLNLFNDLNAQDLNETHMYSARINSIIKHVSTYSHNYNPRDFNSGVWERSYFPGVFVLLVLVFSLIALFNKINYQLEIAEIREFHVYAFIIFLCAIILSFGPYLYNGKSLRFYSVFYFLSAFIPGVENIRAPGRFGMFFGLFYGISVVVVYRFMLHVLDVRKKFIIFSIIAAFIYDASLALNKFDAKYEDQDLHKMLASYIKDKEPVIIFPIKKEGHIETIKNIMDQMNGSFYHWGWNVVGYGSRNTPELNKIIDLDGRFQATGDSREFKDLIIYSCEIGVSKVVFSKAKYNYDGDYPKRVICYDLIYSDVKSIVYARSETK
jgi:hypothetical protein